MAAVRSNMTAYFAGVVTGILVMLLVRRLQRGSVKALIRRGEKIAAVKRYRALHGVDLKAALTAVEEIEARLREKR